MASAGSDNLAPAVAALDRLRYPSDIAFEPGGQTLVAAVRPADRAPGASYASRLWRFGTDGTARELTHGPNGDYLPRCSPTDGRIAFASDRAVRGKADLMLLDGDDALPLGAIPGTVENLRWASDGRAILVLAADRGLDCAATDGATRLAWGAPEDPAVDNPGGPRRRLFRVDAATGETLEVGPPDLSVWEFDLLGPDAAICLASDDPSERGWYHAQLVRIDFASRTTTPLHRSSWQLLAPTASPSGARIAFLDGWSSDRGLVASEIRILDLATGALSTIAAPEASDVTSLEWRDEDSLWFAGWQRLGAVCGIVETGGRIVWSHREDAIIGPNSFSASIAPTPDGTGFVAVRETVGAPPEIALRRLSETAWTPLTQLNTAIAADLSAHYPEVRPLRWQGPGGLELEGLVLLPRGRGPEPLPTIVSIHGGPSWAAKHAFDPGYTLPFAAAGYAVFLPNYRGNTGWGQTFARLNIGDPGGAEFQDILAGIDRCVEEGFTDPSRLGVTGASYGGYMTAWAVATSDRFRAAVMVSGISNQLSSHYSCNHDFHGFINGGPLGEKRHRDVALDRSPILRLDRPTTPTLILHGAEDCCTPLGQAQEFYNALRERGVAAELVVYPREGHGLQEHDHRLDAWRRSVAWFDRHLGRDR